jgi:hypothetical protein
MSRRKKTPEPSPIPAEISILRGAGDANREAAAKRSRERTIAVADIGDLPALIDPDRRDRCRLDLKLFLATYFPASTGLKPFSQSHTDAISRIQQCAIDGGLFVQAFPRGFAKTTISENAALWAVLYGHRRFVPIFASGADGSAGNIDSIKLELSENELLYADFPEVCHAVRALEGKPQRCGSQTYQGQQTHIEWRADTIVLPTIPGSVASGAIIAACSIMAASRGMKHKRPDGTQQRPDFVVIDDPQTDESAATELQVRKRLDVIRKSILKLGGHNRKIAVVMNATVIRPDDLIETLLDAKKFPAWQGMRIKMVSAWSKTHDTLWLGDYARLRNTYDGAMLGDQQRAHRAATEFYQTNRGKMDEACAVAWEHCFDPATELSAIQHAYNALIDDGPEVFASECQNEPTREKDQAGDQITAKEIAEKITGRDRGLLPPTASHLVSFIDVQKNALYWMCVAFADDFTGEIVDYDTFPDQRRKYFAYKDVRRTLQKETGKESLEEAIYAGLDMTVGNLMSRDWLREDGAVMKPSAIQIDANWGDSTDVIYQFCRQSAHTGILMPSHGQGIGAKNRPMSEYHRKPGDRVGLNWRMPNVAGRRTVRYVTFNSNFWKSFVFSRLRVGMGGRGCLSLFGKEPEDHRLLADHIVSERGIPVTASDRTVTEWELRVKGSDNHWLDCLVGCHVAASVRGVKIPESPGMVERIVKRVRFSEMQRRS